MLPRFIIALLFLSTTALADGSVAEFGGHTKMSLTGQAYPEGSLFRDLVGSNTLDIRGDLRLVFKARTDGWSVAADYQLLAAHGDSLELAALLPGGTDIFFAGLPNDDRRLLDLTDTLHSAGKTALLHRLDRLTFGYTSEKTVLRIGRQALSWGNGLFYAPMDLVNPFDPAAVDTEYKAGDDMLYAQYLRDSGDDIQVAYVARRDVASGQVKGDSATVAAKYHGFVGAREYDLLVSRHYGDTVAGLGINDSWGGAIWRADVVATRTASDTRLQLLANLTYSWNWFDRNMSGAIEYFYNGFGQRAGTL